MSGSALWKRNLMFLGRKIVVGSVDGMDGAVNVSCWVKMSGISVIEWDGDKPMIEIGFGWERVGDCCGSSADTVSINGNNVTPPVV